LLLHEARALSRSLRTLVLGLRGGSLLDDALDDALADPHPQVIDGGVLGQRKDIDAFSPQVAGVGELLTDASSRDGAGHDHVDVGVQHGRRHERLGSVHPVEQRAFGDAPRGSMGVLRPGGGGRQGGDEAREHDQACAVPSRTRARSAPLPPAGDVVPVGAGLPVVVSGTVVGIGIAAASLRNSRWTRRLICWHSFSGSSQSAPSLPIVITRIAVSGTPSSTRNSLTDSARRWASVRLYSAEPWRSVWPGTGTTQAFDSSFL